MSEKLKELIVEEYSTFWEYVKDIVDEEGWVYTKDSQHLLDVAFENNTGRDVEFQKSFGLSGDNPYWKTKGSRWRPKNISIYLKLNK